MLRCPVCHDGSVKAYFLKRFTCGNCGTELSSDLVAITAWEGVLAIFLLWIPHWAVTRLLGNAWYVEWLVFWPLIVVAHFVLLSFLVRLSKAI